jgi:RNA polymerase sigma-70 factor, ECF subfamily
MPQFVAPAQVMDDATVMRRIAEGDMQALAWLYQRDSARIMRYCLAVAHDEQLASDALQDTFVALASLQANGFDASKGSLQGFLMGVARHNLLAALRVAGRFLSTDLHSSDSDQDTHFETETEAHSAQDPMRLQVAQQSTQALMAAVAQLPFSFREVLVLVDLQEMTYEETASLTGVALNTVRTRLHRARKRLATQLSELSPHTAQ